MNRTDPMSDFSDRLLEWYRQGRRELPWREDPTPYHVWLSEIMLQQTRVSAVITYYHRFLKELPDIRALAEADEDTCLKLWEGLGYYSRVRNLHRAAQEIMDRFDGEIPSDMRQLLGLSGIGRYTAAAVSSIAFGERIPAVDGNLLRIYSRLAMYEENIRSPKALKDAAAFYEALMPESTGEGGKDNPCGNFNQALMDLGSSVCIPNAQPGCGGCPLSDFCKVHIMRPERESELPVMPPKREKKTEELTVFVIRIGGRTAVNRRPARGLLAALFEFPNTKGHLSAEEAVEWLRSHHVEPLRITPMGEAEHIFTHRIWKMTGYEVQADPFEEKKIPFIMADAGEIRGRYCIPSAFAAYMRLPAAEEVR